MTATTLEKIIGDAEVAFAVLAEVGPFLGTAAAPAVVGAGIAYKILEVLMAGVKAHEAVTGKKLDLSLLHEIPLIPEKTGP